MPCLLASARVSQNVLYFKKTELCFPVSSEVEVLVSWDVERLLPLPFNKHLNRAVLVVGGDLGGPHTEQRTQVWGHALYFWPHAR